MRNRELGWRCEQRGLGCAHESRRLRVAEKDWCSESDGRKEVGWESAQRRGAACLQFALAGREIEQSPLTLSGEGLVGEWQGKVSSWNGACPYYGWALRRIGALARAIGHACEGRLWRPSRKQRGLWPRHPVFKRSCGPSLAWPYKAQWQESSTGACWGAAPAARARRLRLAGAAGSAWW